MNLQIYIILKLGQNQQFLKVVFDFDVTSTTSHRFIFFKGGSGSSLGLSHGVPCDFGSFIVYSFSILYLICNNHLFFCLSTLISLWTLACEYVLIPSWSFHLSFFLGTKKCAMDLHSTTNLGNGMFFYPLIPFDKPKGASCIIG